MNLDRLRDELEGIVMDVVAGGPNTDKLHKSIRRVLDQRLRREVGAEVKGYDIDVGPDRTGEGIQVEILLHTRQQVQRIRLGARLF